MKDTSQIKEHEPEELSWLCLDNGRTLETPFTLSSIHKINIISKIHRYYLSLLVTILAGAMSWWCCHHQVPASELLLIGMIPLIIRLWGIGPALVVFPIILGELYELKNYDQWLDHYAKVIGWGGVLLWQGWEIHDIWWGKKGFALGQQMALENFEAFMQHAPGPAVIKNDTGEYIFLNAQGRKFVEDICGGIDKNGRPGALPESFINHEREVLATGKAQSKLLPVQSVNGEKWYWWIRFPLQYQGDKNRYIGVIGFDITNWYITEKHYHVQKQELVRLEQELDSAAERAHQEFARSLHDDVLQLLALARIKTAMGIQNQMDNKTVVVQVHELLRQVDLQARRLMIHPIQGDLAHVSLHNALQEVGEKLQEQIGLEVGVEIASEIENESLLFREFLFKCARELLMNVAKHAHAQKASVSLRITSEEWILEVCDNGKGLPGPKTNNEIGHYGIASIQDAVKLYGGRLTIQNREQHGLLCRVLVPLNHLKSNQENS